LGSAYPDDGAERASAVQGLLALDVNYWFAKHFALNLQFQAGAMYVMGPPDSPGLLPLTRIGLGVAF
jgi:hypothetical protein